jgi:hypothetical protein
MMRSVPYLAVLVLLAPGCAHLGATIEAPRERSSLWAEAHDALADVDFARAEVAFGNLAREFPNSAEGRESLFYLGTIRLDPRNDNWDPEPARDRLGEYLALSVDDRSPRLYRYPEARVLHELAHQLTLPADHRVAGLQPEERVVVVPERVVVPAEQSRELAEEVERLRRELAAREARIEQQQQELERIRRTLTPSGS